MYFWIKHHRLIYLFPLDETPSKLYPNPPPKHKYVARNSLMFLYGPDDMWPTTLETHSKGEPVKTRKTIFFLCLSDTAHLPTDTWPGNKTRNSFSSLPDRGRIFIFRWSSRCFRRGLVLSPVCPLSKSRVKPFIFREKMALKSRE